MHHPIAVRRVAVAAALGLGIAWSDIGAQSATAAPATWPARAALMGGTTLAALGRLPWDTVVARARRSDEPMMRAVTLGLAATAVPESRETLLHEAAAAARLATRRAATRSAYERLAAAVVLTAREAATGDRRRADAAWRDVVAAGAALGATLPRGRPADSLGLAPTVAQVVRRVRESAPLSELPTPRTPGLYAQRDTFEALARRARVEGNESFMLFYLYEGTIALHRSALDPRWILADSIVPPALGSSRDSLDTLGDALVRASEAEFALEASLRGEVPRPTLPFADWVDAAQHALRVWRPDVALAILAGARADAALAGRTPFSARDLRSLVFWAEEDPDTELSLRIADAVRPWTTAHGDSGLAAAAIYHAVRARHDDPDRLLRAPLAGLDDSPDPRGAALAAYVRSAAQIRLGLPDSAMASLARILPSAPRDIAAALYVRALQLFAVRRDAALPLDELGRLVQAGWPLLCPDRAIVAALARRTAHPRAVDVATWPCTDHRSREGRRLEELTDLTLVRLFPQP